MTYATAFPDFPAADMPPIPSSWSDESWHNDTCPHFFTEEGLSIFVDYGDPAAREIADAPRFSVAIRSDDLAENADLFASDSWPDVLAYVSTWQANDYLNRRA